MALEDDDTVTQLILLAVGLVGSLGLGYLLTSVFRRLEAPEPDPMTDPVRATLRVTEMSEPDDEGATWRNGWIGGVVMVEGRAPYEVRRPGMFLDAKWPRVGQDLPVVIDRADGRWLNILWDEVEGGGPRLSSRPDTMADVMAAKYHIRMQRKHP